MNATIKCKACGKFEVETDDIRRWRSAHCPECTEPLLSDDDRIKLNQYEHRHGGRLPPIQQRLPKEYTQ